MRRFFQKGGINKNGNLSTMEIAGANEVQAGNDYADWYVKTYGRVDPAIIFREQEREREARKFKNQPDPNIPAIRRYFGQMGINSINQWRNAETPAYQVGGYVPDGNVVMRDGLNEREQQMVNSQALFNAGLGGADYGIRDLGKYYVPRNNVPVVQQPANVRPYSQVDYGVAPTPIDSSLDGRVEGVIPMEAVVAEEKTPLTKKQIKQEIEKLRNDRQELRRIPTKFRDEEVFNAKKDTINADIQELRKGLRNSNHKVYKRDDYAVGGGNSSVSAEGKIITGKMDSSGNLIDGWRVVGDEVVLTGKRSFNSLSSRKKQFHKALGALNIDKGNLTELERYVEFNTEGALVPKDGVGKLPSHISKQMDRINTEIWRKESEKHTQNLEVEAEGLSNLYTAGSYQNLKNGEYDISAAKIAGMGVLHGGLSALQAGAYGGQAIKEALSRYGSSVLGKYGNVVRQVKNVGNNLTAAGIDKLTNITHNATKYPVRNAPTPYIIKNFNPGTNSGSAIVNPEYVKYMRGVGNGLMESFNAANKSIFYKPATGYGVTAAQQGWIHGAPQYIPLDSLE